MAYIGKQPAAVALTSSDITDGIISTAKIAADAVTKAKLEDAIDAFNYKNIIINGDMQVSQRNTTKASVTTAGYYTIDRMQWIADYGTVTLSQDTDVPTGQGFATSLKMDCTTADASPAAADYNILAQIIEGQNVQYLKKGTSSAVPLTLSFWVKSVLTGTYIAELYEINNTRQISKSYTVDSSNTWEKKEITFAGDTTGAFTSNNGASLFVNLWLSAGTDYTSGTLSTSWGAVTNANRAVGQVNLANSTSNNFWITGIQLEVGTVASNFEFLPFDVNLLRCQRYYYLHSSGNGGAGSMTCYYSSSQLGGEIHFPCTMRTSPTLVCVSGTDYYTNFRNGTTDGFDDVITGASYDHQNSWYATDGVSGTAGHAGFYRNGNVASRVSFKAEL